MRRGRGHDPSERARSLSPHPRHREPFDLPTMHSEDTPTRKAAGAAVFEFEAECRGIIIETWRVSVRDADDLGRRGVG